MTIQQVLKKIKKDYDEAITTSKFNGNTYENGHKAKEALIRSQKIINIIHDFIKRDFVENKVQSQKIFPPVGESSPEIKIKGFLKSKNQDIVIIPNIELIPITNTDDPRIKRIISVNVRSQLSSLKKNIDTLYERTFAEALNLHLNHPKQCMGEVYLIPTHEYDDKAMLQNKVEFKSVSNIEEYIRMFQAINNRHSIKGNEYKYERVCLLIVDFRKKSPKLYSSIKELKMDGLVSKNTKVNLKNLTISGFTKDMLDIYTKRFGSKDIF